MVTVGKSVVFAGEAGRHQELLNRRVGKLHDPGIFSVDNRKQYVARGWHRINRIFRTPILVKLWDWTSLEIECENVSQLLNSERAASHSDA
jgi:hypothetical protein